MSGLLRLLKGEPVATMAIVTAAIGLATILGAPEKAMGAIAVLLGAVLAFPVRDAVAPVAAVVETTRKAAADAAAQVASRLDGETVGQVGVITDHAAELATTAADAAADAALRNLGVGRKARAA